MAEDSTVIRQGQEWNGFNLYNMLMIKLSVYIHIVIIVNNFN